MRVIIATASIATVSVILAAGPAFAGEVPAPLVAAGLPAAVVVGGVLLATRLFKKR